MKKFFKKIMFKVCNAIADLYYLTLDVRWENNDFCYNEAQKGRFIHWMAIRNRFR